MTDKEKYGIFRVLRLTTGLTIFAETVGTVNGYFLLKDPMVLKQTTVNDRPIVFLTKWVSDIEYVFEKVHPITDSETIEIKQDFVYYNGCMAEYYVKLYGETLMREEVSELIKTMFKSPESVDNESITERIEEINEFYSIKYGVRSGVYSEISEDVKKYSETDIASDRTLH